jgi:hypothetical protein
MIETYVARANYQLSIAKYDHNREKIIQWENELDYWTDLLKKRDELDKRINDVLNH